MIQLLLFPVILFLFVIVRYFIVLKRKQSKGKKSLQKYVSTMIVLGSGGHTTEMVEIIKNLNANFYPKIFIVATSDVTSENRLQCFDNVIVEKIPRSREVKQSYITSVFTTLNSILFSLGVVWRYKPDLILCNGPGTCIPICFWGFLLKIFYISSSKIIYIESICRVKTLSLSGLIIYYSGVYEEFYVHWSELKAKYPKTKLNFFKNCIENKL